MKTGIVIPKVFTEANFSNLPTMGKRGVSQVEKRGKTQSAFRGKQSIFFSRKVGIAVEKLPFKDCGLVVHKYARPSRIVTEEKIDVQEGEERFSGRIKKFMNRFSEVDRGSYVFKPGREGFLGCKRSKVFLEVIKRCKGGKK